MVSSLSEFLRQIPYIKIEDVLKLELVRYMQFRHALIPVNLSDQLILNIAHGIDNIMLVIRKMNCQASFDTIDVH